MAFLKHIWNRWQNLLHDEKLKHKIYVIIFESDTPMGKLFDVALIGFIVLSILVVVAESIKSWDAVIGPYLRVSEYVFTFFFTLEYVLRLYCSPKPRKYALSFFGIVDLLATLPLYIGWLFGTARYLLVIRTFRLIRVFRIFKLFNYLNEGNFLLRSLVFSSRLWGYYSGNSVRALPFGHCNVTGLYHHCSSHRNCVCIYDSGTQAQGGPEMSALW